MTLLSCFDCVLRFFYYDSISLMFKLVIRLFNL